MSGPTARAAREIQLPGYRVSVSPGALSFVAELARDTTNAHRFAIVTDANVARLHARAIVSQFDRDQAILCTIEPGESRKTREVWASVTDELLEAGLGRDGAVIALGGGVVGDLAGFVAATYMRGIPVLQVPTTLLAMIDASIGGKTGVDTPAGKNLVGAFHRPSAVVVDPLVLDTLPTEHLRAGMAEAIKHAVIADRAWFDRLVERVPALLAAAAHRAAPEPELFADLPAPARRTDNEHPEGLDALTELIARSIEVKADVVRRDEREAGLRKTLNFGHTLGHAIELLSGYAMLHGEAIAIGMTLEARLAEEAGIAAEGTTEELRAALTAAGLPTSRPSHMPADRVLAATRTDKKARAGAVEYALPRRIGEMAGEDSGWSVHIEDALVLEALQDGA